MLIKTIVTTFVIMQGIQRKNRFDITIGTVVNVLNDNVFQMRVERVGINNISDYHNRELVQILHLNKGTSHYLLGKTVKCQVRFRNEFNILFSDVEVIDQ